MKNSLKANIFFPQNLSNEISQERLARIQVQFNLIAIIFSIGYFLFSSYQKFIVIQYVTAFSFFFFLALQVAYKLGVLLRIISHLFVLFFWLIVVTVAFFSGGIESYILVWIAPIPVLAVTLLSSRASLIWGIIATVTVFVFYYVEIDSFIPSHLLVFENKLWNATLHIGLQIFILALTFVFSRNQSELIRKIKRQHQEISKQNDFYKTNHDSIKKLSEIGAKIISSLSIDTIIESVYKNVNSLLNAEVFSFGVYNEANNRLEFSGAFERGKMLRSHYYLLDDNAKMAVRCFKQQEVIFTNDVAKDNPVFTKPVIGESTLSVIYVPVIHNSKALGVLSVQSFNRDAYTSYHISILTNLAAYVSIALENARMYGRIEKSYENISLLNKIGQDISSNISIDNIVHSVYKSISTLMSTSKFGIGIINKTENVIKFKEHSTNSDKFLSLEFPMDNKDWLVVECVVNKREIFSGNVKEDYAQNIISLKIPEPRNLLLNSIMIVPLLIQEEVIGCIAVQCKQNYAYSDYHLNLLRSISIDVSIAVQNSLTFDQLEKKSDENKILFDLSSNLIESLELEELLDKIMDSAVKLVPNAQSGSIFLQNDENKVLEGKVSYGISNEQIKKIRLKEGEGLSGKAIAEKRNFIENNYVEDPLLSIENKQVLDKSIKPIKSIIVVLLKVEQKIIGTISLDNYDKHNAFTDVDLGILSSMAANASVAIERVRMYETIETVNGDLIMAYSKLKELDEYKEAMTAMIVHDFKNSLNTVISFSEGAPTERRLKSIRQAGQFMLNMVHNILDVQKFETAKFKLALGNYSINKIIENALDQLSYTIEQKSIKLSYAPNNNLYSRVDYELMTRVVINILSNAIKYVTTNGEIEIIVEKKEKDIYVAIKDNGSGIPSDKLNQVFEKYSQLDAKKSGSVRSTGIGLTFCKMVVEAHKGMIGVESKDGEGSVFYFTLPLLEEDKELKTLNEKYDIKKGEVLMFSKEERISLTPYLSELQNWEVYDYSEVAAILDTIHSRHATVVLWKEKMMKALQNVNEDEFNMLISIIEYEQD